MPGPVDQASAGLVLGTGFEDPMTMDPLKDGRSSGDISIIGVPCGLGGGHQGRISLLKAAFAGI